MPQPTARFQSPNLMARRLWLVAGWSLIGVGIPIFLLPIPLGAALVLTGGVILARNSPKARTFMRQTYRRFPRTLQPLRSFARRRRRRARRWA